MGALKLEIGVSPVPLEQSNNRTSVFPVLKEPPPDTLEALHVVSSFFSTATLTIFLKLGFYHLGFS